MTLSLLCVFSAAKAEEIPVLSDQATISVLTCSPGELLYEAFGHTAVRVREPGQFDIVYNYGIFSYSQDNFYVNFAKGFLWYRLGVSRFERFMHSYSQEDRRITEQVLNLDSIQKNDLFTYLEWNRLPENASYQYHYFDDNCATRVMFVMDSVKSIDVRWNSAPSLGYNESSDPHIKQFGLSPTEFGKPYQTYRDMVRRYTKRHQWMRLGIDLCQGLPVDKQMTDVQYSFLPDYFMLALAYAQIKTPTGTQPMVLETKELHQAPKLFSFFHIDWPTVVLNVIWSILIIVTLFGFRFRKHFKAVDYLLFSITGLLGLFMLGMWLLTEHYHCEWNLNILWASPINLIAIFVASRPWAKKYFKVYSIVQVLILLTWFVIFPQVLHPGFFGLVFLLALRSWKLSR